MLLDLSIGNQQAVKLDNTRALTTMKYLIFSSLGVQFTYNLILSANTYTDRLVNTWNTLDTVMRLSLIHISVYLLKLQPIKGNRKIKNSK